MRTFPKGISTKWIANWLVQDLNSWLMCPFPIKITVTPWVPQTTTSSTVLSLVFFLFLSRITMTQILLFFQIKIIHFCQTKDFFINIYNTFPFCHCFCSTTATVIDINDVIFDGPIICFAFWSSAYQTWCSKTIKLFAHWPQSICIQSWDWPTVQLSSIWCF